jgi:hypothetical protein
VASDYVVNTNWDVLEHTPARRLYLRYNRSWLQAKAIEGPWTQAGKLPESFSKLPPDENWKDVKAALPGERLHRQDDAQSLREQDPAELILLQGPPSYLKVEGATTLLWVNTHRKPICFRMGQQARLLLSSSPAAGSRAIARRTVDVRHAVVAGGLQAHSPSNIPRVTRARLDTRDAASDRSGVARDGAAHARASTRKS